MKSSSQKTNYYLSKTLFQPDSIESGLKLDESKGEIMFGDYPNRDLYIKSNLKDIKASLSSLRESTKEIKKSVINGLINQKEDFLKIQKEIEITQKPLGALSKDIAATSKLLHKSKNVLQEADKTVEEYKHKISKLKDTIKNDQSIFKGLITYLHIGGKKFVNLHKKLKLLKDNFSKTKDDKPGSVGLDTSWLTTGSLQDEKNKKIGIIVVSTIAALIISLGVSANILGTDYLWESITDIFIYIIVAVVGVALFFAGPWGAFFGLIAVIGSLMGIYEAFVKAPFLIAIIVICVSVPAAGLLWVGSSEQNLDTKFEAKQNEAALLNKSNETQWQNKLSAKSNEFYDFYNKFKSEIVGSSSSEPDLSNVSKDDLETIEKIIIDWNNEIDELHTFEAEMMEILNSLKTYRSKNHKSDIVLDTLQATWAQHS